MFCWQVACGQNIASTPNNFLMHEASGYMPRGLAASTGGGGRLNVCVPHRPPPPVMEGEGTLVRGGVGTSSPYLHACICQAAVH